MGLASKTGLRSGNIKADLVNGKVPFYQLSQSMQICILGISFVGRSIYGTQAFIVGVDKVGEETVL